jgi:hypothetical protein
MPKVFQNVIYLQIRRRWVGIRFFGWSGRFHEWEGAPEAVISLDRAGKQYALGPEDPRILAAFQPRLFAAFDHPRVPICGFEETVLTMAMLLRQICKRQRVRATFVVHVRDEWLGGITDIEQRALVQLTRELGASRTLLVDAGRELSAPEVLSVVRTGRPISDGVTILA